MSQVLGQEAGVKFKTGCQGEEPVWMGLRGSGGHVQEQFSCRDAGLSTLAVIRAGDLIGGPTQIA